MNYEIFEMKQRTEPDRRELAAAAQFGDQMQAAEQAGLTTQGKNLDGKKMSAEVRAQYETIPLTPGDFLIWNKWAPHPHDVNNYCVGTIPSDVLKHWGSCKKLGIFSRYRILTKYSPYDKRWPKSESLLIGIVGEDNYLLARWAEPEKELRSFTDIKMIVWKQCVRDAIFSERLMVLSITSLLCVWMVIGAITQSVIVGLIAGAIAFGYGAIKSRDHILKDDDTAQALMKYGCQSEYGYSPFHSDIL